MGMADRVYCPDPPVGGRFTIRGDEARHLTRVRRVGEGDDVEVFDGHGFATRARVAAVERERVELIPHGQPLPDRMPPCRLVLATAVPKGERFDWLVEKATELGVSELIPLVTERSVVDPRDTKLDRLRRVIVEAAKQCGRSRLMELTPPTRWTEVLASRSETVRLVAHPGGALVPEWPLISAAESVILAVGPEGGFSDEEALSALAAGWRTINLGKTLLRIETAGIAGCSAILTLCEGWGQ